MIGTVEPQQIVLLRIDERVLSGKFPRFRTYMSAGKLDTSGVFDVSEPVIDADHVLHLSPANTLIRHNGIEFHYGQEIPQFTEMTVDMHDPEDGSEIKATGVVVSCSGDRHKGYQVSMVLMDLSSHNQARLSLLAYSNLA